MKSLWIIPFIYFFSCGDIPRQTLPILGRKVVKETIVDGQKVIDSVYPTIQDFRFMDQDSNWITRELMEGKIYIADFFFTTCPTICPVMKRNMKKVHEKYKNDDEIWILSHTIDPKHDTIPVLKKYADAINVDAEHHWHFLTGNRDSIFDLAERSYMVSAEEDPNAPGGAVHSGAFILIDKKGRIRGYYDGTDEQDVLRLIRDIKLLNPKRNNQRK